MDFKPLSLSTAAICPISWVSTIERFHCSSLVQKHDFCRLQWTEWIFNSKPSEHLKYLNSDPLSGALPLSLGQQSVQLFRSMWQRLRPGLFELHQRDGFRRLHESPRCPFVLENRSWPSEIFAMQWPGHVPLFNRLRWRFVCVSKTFECRKTGATVFWRQRFGLQLCHGSNIWWTTRTTSKRSELREIYNERISFQVQVKRKPWHSGGQIAGYVKRYENLDVLTVKVGL